MDGIVNIVKQLLGSKQTCAAALFTALVFQFGPKYVSDFPTLPEGWTWVPGAIAAFTGFFCVWWIVKWVGSGLLKIARALLAEEPTALEPSHLRPDEKHLLKAIAAEGQLYLTSESNIESPRVL